MLVTYKANYTLEYSYKEITKLFGGYTKEYPVNHYNDKLCFKGVCKDSAVKTEVQKQVQQELKRLNSWWAKQENITDFSGFKIIVSPSIMIKPIRRMTLSEIKEFEKELTLEDIFTVYNEFLNLTNNAGGDCYDCGISF